MQLTHGLTVGLDGGARVLELYKLMTHKGPRGQAPAIKAEGLQEVRHRLLVLPLEAVVVSCRKKNQQQYRWNL